MANTFDSANDHTQRGKWSQRGVPQKGWNCIGIEDLGESSQLCEMCESVEIRYVHYMEHPDYTETLAVGCICAEHMEHDYVRPRKREARLKKAARRRITWQSKIWVRSAKGNLYVNFEGFNLTAYESKSGWAIVVTNRISNVCQTGRKTYESEDAAQKASLDALLWAKENLT